MKLFNSQKKHAVITAKIISVFSFIFVLAFCYTEIMTFAGYVIPFLTVSFYQMFDKVQSANSSISANVSLYTVIFPSVFLIIVTAMLHYRFISFLIKKTAKWMISVMKQ